MERTCFKFLEDAENKVEKFQLIRSDRQTYRQKVRQRERDNIKYDLKYDIIKYYKQ